LKAGGSSERGQLRAFDYFSPHIFFLSGVFRGNTWVT